MTPKINFKHSNYFYAQDNQCSSSNAAPCSRQVWRRYLHDDRNVRLVSTTEAESGGGGGGGGGSATTPDSHGSGCEDENSAHLPSSLRQERQVYSNIAAGLPPVTPYLYHRYTNNDTDSSSISSTTPAVATTVPTLHASSGSHELRFLPPPPPPPPPTYFFPFTPSPSPGPLLHATTTSTTLTTTTSTSTNNSSNSSTNTTSNNNNNNNNNNKPSSSESYCDYYFG